LKKPTVFSYDKGYRFNSAGWTYVHIEGDSYSRGLQHGYLLAPEIEESMKCLKHITYFNTGKDWSFFVREAEKQFSCKIDEEYLDEICGIADGASKAGIKVTWQDILTLNSYGELIYYWWPFFNEGKLSKVNGLSSAFIATGTATKNGKIILAHNTGESFERAQFFNVIIDLKPSKGHRIFMQTSPGYIHSFTNFFVNSRGIIGADTTIANFNRYDVNGTPKFYRSRKAMQYADDMCSFVEIMKNRSSCGYNSSWLLGDINTNHIMLFEQGYEFTNVKSIDDGYFIGFNAPEDSRIRNLECTNSGYMDIRCSQGAKRVRLNELLNKYYGKIDIELAKLLLADHHDVYLNKIEPSCRTIDSHYHIDDQVFPTVSFTPLPYEPQGTVDGKVIDSELANKLSFWARWGNSSGIPFSSKKYFSEHPEWNHLNGYLKDRFTEPWTMFKCENK